MKLIALLLALLAGPTVDDGNVDQTRERAYARYAAWFAACDLTQLCDGTVRPPEVTYEPMFGLRGYYSGGDTIFINSLLAPGVDVMSTLIHETIHYLHTQYLGMPSSVPLGPELKGLCWSEETAFSLTDRWLVSIGREDLVRGPTWWKAYWHCEPFYDPDFDMWDWVQRGLRRF